MLGWQNTFFDRQNENGLPQTCVIDLMLLDENGLHFLTAKGKNFYERLMTRGYVAVRAAEVSVLRNVSVKRRPVKSIAAAACTAETASAFAR